MGIRLLLASAGAPAQDLSIFDPASPPAESIRGLAVLVLAITAFIFVVVEGILFYSVFRFRRRAAAGTAEPPQVYGSKPIEIAWTAAPAVIVFVLVLVTARTLWEVNVPPPQPKAGDNTLFVTVVGRPAGGFAPGCATSPAVARTAVKLSISGPRSEARWTVPPRVSVRASSAAKRGSVRRRARCCVFGQGSGK